MEKNTLSKLEAENLNAKFRIHTEPGMGEESSLLGDMGKTRESALKK